MHGFLVDSVNELRAVSDRLHAMLRVVIRGICHAVAICHYHMTAPEERTGLSPGPEVFRTLIRKKRLFANFIFFKAHWTAVI
ncbi:hypothetical protein GGI42DRAFT_337482 [Trichoderma sp. SZMC 28013]